MTSFCRRWAVLVGVLAMVLLTSGCLDPRFTRMPRLWAAHPIAENKAFELTDPFPDPDYGPDTYARPRGYMTPRTEPHRAAQQRLLNDLLRHPESIPPQRSTGNRRYDNSVQ